MSLSFDRYARILKLFKFEERKVKKKTVRLRKLNNIIQLYFKSHFDS